MAHNFEYIVVGHVIKAWGIKGAVKVEVLTDFPDRFAPGKQVYIDGHPLTIERSHPHKDRLIVKLCTINDLATASKLQERDIEIPIQEAHALPPGEYYRFQVMGLDVWGTNEEPVGKIEDILPTGSNDVYIVRGPHGEVLIPATEDVVKSIDLENGRMIIRIIDGLW